MKKRILLLSIFSLIFFTACGGSRQTIHIIHVTDAHGHLYPFDYKRATLSDHSIAQVYTYVDSLRKAGEKVLFIDTGDLLQGTPMVYYFNKIDTSVTNPAALLYNFTHLDAMVVGNHDIEQGPAVYRKFQKELDAPLLSANAVLPDGQSAFPSYVIFNIGGKKIGLIGLTTPAIPLWLNPSLYPEITWKDIVKSAKPLVAKLRPQVDFLIAGVHAGIDSASSLKETGARNLPNENDVLNLARACPELGLILCGHEHRLIPGKYYQNKPGNVPISMAKNAAYYFNEIIVEPGKPVKIIPHQTKYYKPFPGAVKLLKPYHEKTIRYINTPLTVLSDKLDMKKAYFYDNAILDFIQQAQLAYSGADVSFASCFTTRAMLPADTVRIKDIFSIYRYENYLYGIKMTGGQIKRYLEASAEFLQDRNSVKLTNGKIPGYNFDIAANVDYTIDISKPLGKRITINRIAGRKYSAKAIFKVAMNSYRFNGGGGLLEKAGVENPEPYYISDEEIRNLLIQYLREGGKLKPEPDNNWKIIGDPEFSAKVKAYIK